MLVIEFIARKNKIIFDACGVTLVPQEQIKEIPKNKLGTSGDSDACPYCREFLILKCVGCPMMEAGNHCGDDGSTWVLVREALNKDLGRGIAPHIIFSGVSKDLKILITEFNKDLGE